MKRALILVVESDINNTDSKNNIYRYFEKEAIHCIKPWNKYNENIDIICICISYFPPSNETIKQFYNLGVIYEHHPFEITNTFDCGFYNKVLGCKYVEQTYLEYDCFLHLDLDMYSVKKFNWPSQDSCLVYDDIQKKYERKQNYSDIFNTCLIVTYSKDFYKNRWIKLLQLINKEIEYKVKDLDFRKLEEMSFDLHSLNYNIKSLNDYIAEKGYPIFEGPPPIIFIDGLIAVSIFAI